MANNQREAIKSAAFVGSALLVLVVMVLATQQEAEARYLPTRADETQAEVLKEIIRNLLNEATAGTQLNNQMVRQARFFANTNRAHRLLMNGAAYAYQPTGSESMLRNAAAYIQRRSAERVDALNANGGDDMQSLSSGGPSDSQIDKLDR